MVTRGDGLMGTVLGFTLWTVWQKRKKTSESLINRTIWCLTWALYFRSFQREMPKFKSRSPGEVGSPGREFRSGRGGFRGRSDRGIKRIKVAAIGRPWSAESQNHWTTDITTRLHNTGRKPAVGRRPTTGCAHSKISRVRVLSWLLPLQTSMYFLRVTEVGHTVTKFPTIKCHESLLCAVKGRCHRCFP